MLTFPPLGVNLRALSARVFIMNKVNTLSAFTTASVCLTSSSIPLALKVVRFLPIISNKSLSLKLPTLILSRPSLSFIHCVSKVLLSLICSVSSSIYCLRKCLTSSSSVLVFSIRTSFIIRSINGNMLVASEIRALCSRFSFSLSATLIRHISVRSRISSYFSCCSAKSLALSLLQFFNGVSKRIVSSSLFRFLYNLLKIHNREIRTTIITTTTTRRVFN